MERNAREAWSPFFRVLARRRLGELRGDDEGAALLRESDAVVRAGGVVHPDRITATLLPGIEIR